MTLAVLPLLLLAAQAARAQATGKTTIGLNSGWTFRQVGREDWRKATVPGSVHTDLLANRLIEDPFYRDNEPKLQWVGKTDWEYRTTFDVTAAVLARRNVELVFEGLDTYATVYLNERQVLEADNMFRTWRVDAKPALKAGANTLRVVFRSPINEILPRMKALGYELPASNDQGEKTSPHTRKAPYQYGWDWGPRFVTCGLWKPARLEAWDNARLSGLHVLQNHLGRDSAQLTAEVEVESSGSSDAVVVIEDPSDKRVAARQTLKLSPGANRFALKLSIPNPQLWWPAGLGSQKLYTLRAPSVRRESLRRTLDARRPADARTKTAAGRRGQEFYFRRQRRSRLRPGRELDSGRQLPRARDARTLPPPFRVGARREHEHAARVGRGLL